MGIKETSKPLKNNSLLTKFMDLSAPPPVNEFVTNTIRFTEQSYPSYISKAEIFIEIISDVPCEKPTGMGTRVAITHSV